MALGLLERKPADPGRVRRWLELAKGNLDLARHPPARGHLVDPPARGHLVDSMHQTHGRDVAVHRMNDRTAQGSQRAPARPPRCPGGLPVVSRGPDRAPDVRSRRVHPRLGSPTCRIVHSTHDLRQRMTSAHGGSGPRRGDGSTRAHPVLCPTWFGRLRWTTGYTSARRRHRLVDRLAVCGGHESIEEEMSA